MKALPSGQPDYVFTRKDGWTFDNQGFYTSQAEMEAIMRIQDQRSDDPCTKATRLVALRIRELCFMNNLTLSELASKADMPLSSLRDIINGKNRDMRLSSLVRIAMGLNTDLAYFFDSDVFEPLRPGALKNTRPF